MGPEGIGGGGSSTGEPAGRVGGVVEEAALIWQKQEQHIALVRRPGETKILGLGLTMPSPGQWLAFAFAAELPDLSGGPLVAAAAFFDNHAHDTIGAFKSERAAKRAAKKYARAWLAGAAPEACGCGPIETGAAPAQPGEAIS